MFPKAPIYTLLYDESKVGHIFPKEKVITSKLQKLPAFIRKRYRYLLPEMPKAIEEFDFEEFDLVISSSTAFAHGIITPIKTKHICYCHSPMRYGWDWANEYQKENNISGLKKLFYAPLMKYLRQWDFLASDRPDKYVTGEREERIRAACRVH